MHTYEPNNFKTEKPFDTSYDHPQDFTPVYMAEPEFIVTRDTSLIPKKGLIRQILDLPKDIQEMKRLQRTLKEDVLFVECDIKKVDGKISGFDGRMKDADRKILKFQDEMENLNRKSESFQKKVDSLSTSINPIESQIAELKLQTLKIKDLTTQLNQTKRIVGLLFLVSCALATFIAAPFAMRIIQTF